MTDRQRMSPSELRARREYLGLTQEALSLALGRHGSAVRADTVRRWESGREPVPYGVPAEVEQIEVRTQRFVDDLRARPAEQVFYDSDTEVRLRTLGWCTARWWRHCIIRSRGREDA